MMNKPTAELLEAHFDAAFSAPNGIQKLRELILTLAMQGKLVPQDPNDPPASELLKEIEAEKKRLVKEGKIKTPKLLPPVTKEENPYALPEGWEWVRLGEILTIVYGKGLPTSNLTADGYDVFGANGIIGKYSKYLYEFPQLLISCRGAYSGKPNISPPKCFVTSNSLVLESTWEYICLHFLFFALTIADKSKIVTGSAQPQVTTTNLEPFLVPLPSLKEQHRIVAKIDELMARCDVLENLRTQREEKRLAVHAAAIIQLLNIAQADEHQSAQAFLAEHFGELYTVKQNVAELRKAILQLAVMGKLVPQDPNDQPASELLKEIETEKKRLLKEGKIKTQKPLPPVTEEEKPYALPERWEWVRLGELGTTQTGTTPPSKDRDNYGDYIPFIGPGDIKNGMIDYSGEGLSESGLSCARLIEKNSVLMVCIGGSIGKHAINVRDLACNQQINTITPFHPFPVRFPYWAMATNLFQRTVLESAGGSATPIINKQKWSSIPIPVPPLPEQHRIVAKIDQLMVLCDNLDEQIVGTTVKQAELLNAVMAQVQEISCV